MFLWKPTEMVPTVMRRPFVTLQGIWSSIEREVEESRVLTTVSYQSVCVCIRMGVIKKG